MVYSKSIWKFDQIDLFFLVFILFIMLSVVTFADVETLEFDGVSSVSITTNYNYFVSGGRTAYLKLDKGYRYTVSVLSSSYRYAFSNDVPAPDVLFYNSSVMRTSSPVSIIADDNFTYLFFDVSVGADSLDNFVITREYIPSYSGVNNLLVENVGVSQFWDIFTLSIPFILIVVIVVFGFFIIRRLTKKESKGDIRF